MNSTTASYDPFAGDEDLLEKGPKETGSLPNLKLHDGNIIPMLGFGVGSTMMKPVGDEQNFDKNLVETMVKAIKAGYHHLDAAEVYGTEEELGVAIKLAGVPREKLFVTTKRLCRDDDTTEARFAESLRKLQLDYVDMYLIHTPFFANGNKQKLQQRWAEMEAIHKSGRAKSIGVSNYLQEHLEATLETAAIKPVVNQIEYHPYLQHGNLLDFHRRHHIATAAYGPLTALTKAAPGPVDDLYGKLARKYGVTEYHIALRWCTDRGVIAITTTSNEDRMKQYLRVKDFKLTPKEVNDICVAGQQKHYRAYFTRQTSAGDKR